MRFGGSTQNLPVSPYGPSLGRQSFAGVGRPNKQGKQEHQATPPRHKVTLKQIGQPCIFRRRRSVLLIFPGLLTISNATASLLILQHTTAAPPVLLRIEASTVSPGDLVRPSRYRPTVLAPKWATLYLPIKPTFTVSDTASTPYRNLFLGLP